MAWQTPKTDWAAPDGVRNTDFNRIEGNILDLYNTDAVRNNITIYVSPTGNDASGNGTQSSPYASITKALSVIPKNLNGKTVSISVASGTYPEDVVVSGFTGGMLSLTGSAITINKLEVNACCFVIDGITVNTTAGIGFLVTNGATLITTGNISGNNSTVCVAATNCSRVHIGGNIALNGPTTGITCNNASHVYFSSATGSNVGTGMTASNGGIIIYGSFTATIRTAIFATSTGGRVYTGSQTGGGGGGVL